MQGRLLPKDRLLVAAPEPVRRKRFNELFDKADELDYCVVPFIEQQIEIAKETGDEVRRESLNEHLQYCRKKSTAMREYACDYFGEEF